MKEQGMNDRELELLAKAMEHSRKKHEEMYDKRTSATIARQAAHNKTNEE